jgi:hypothetical protein
VVLIVIFSLGNETHKSFQGFPYDRFAYLLSAITFANSQNDILSTNFKELFSFGNITPFIIDNGRSRFPGEFYSRPSVEFLFATLSTPFPQEMYKLANAFEQLFRLILFFTLIRFGILFRIKRNFSVLISFVIIIGFWTQNVKDYNAWAMQLSIPIWIFIFLQLLPNRSLNFDKSRFIIYVTLITSALIIYPEGSIWFINLLFLSLIFYVYLIKKSIKQIVVPFVGILSSYILFIIINLKSFSFIKKQFGALSAYSNDVVAKSASNLLLPFNGSLSEKYENIVYLSNPFINPLKFLQNFYNFQLGEFGYYLLLNFNGFIKISFFILILFFFIKLRKSFITDSINFFSFIFLLIFLIAPFFLLWTGKQYGWGRGIIYSGIICSTIYSFLLARNFKYIIAKFLLFVFFVINIIFASVNLWFTFDNKYESFPFSYENNKDRIYFYSSNGKVKDKISFDTQTVSDMLKFCDTFYIDLKNQWQEAYVISMLKSHNKRYILSHKSMTGVWDGHPWDHNIPKKELYNCIVESVNIKGVDRIDLIFTDMNLSTIRGQLK